MKTLAIDWDGTWTADPSLFCALGRNAEAAGWRVYIVTNRSAHEPVGATYGFSVIYCAGAPKREACARAGIRVDVWVDDMLVLVDFGQAGLDRLRTA